MQNKRAKTGSSPKRASQRPAKPEIPEGEARVGQIYFYAGAILSFLISFAFYLRTMARSASFWDSGEFIATSYILGIPHSPGTPLYVLVGRVFTLLPLPMSTAQKVNLISVLCGALGVLIVFILVVKFLDYIWGKSKREADTAIKVVGGVIGALFLAFSDTYWVNSIEAEVYAMSCFLMGFMTWLGLKWEENPMRPKATLLIYLLFYLLAMSVGFHLGTILAVSGIFFFVLLTREKPFTDFEFIVACIAVGIFVADATLYRNGRLTFVLIALYLPLVVWLSTKKSRLTAICTGLFILGLSVHFYLLIRSAHNPAIDEGDPETWRSLYFALRREQYPAMNIIARKASFIFQLQHFNAYFQTQFEMAKMFIGKLNIGSILPIGLGIWGIIDHYAKHKKSFIMLFVTLVVTSLGLIIFLNFSDAEVRERDYFYSPAFYYFAVFIGIGAASLLSEVRNALRKKDALGRVVIYTLGAVLLALPFFTARNHFFTHDRSRNYTCRDYAINMLIGLDRDAVLFTNGDNDTFPLWYIQEVENYRKDILVVNLSLLNTPWYIKQLRDNEPKAPISWSDREIDNLGHFATKEGWILIRDQAVRHILRENRWKQPIYFAVTIPPETYSPYRDYLEMQGLAYLLVPRKGKNMINEEIMKENIMHKFSYRSILTEDWKKDNSVYLPGHTRHLIQNYAGAFIQLAFSIRDKNPKEALRYLEIAQQISPGSEHVARLLGLFYFESGDTAKAIAHYENEIRKHPNMTELLWHLAGIYERTGDDVKTLDLLDELLRRNPNDRNTVLSALGLSLRANLYKRGRNYLTQWLSTHPNDEDIRKRLNWLDSLMKVTPAEE